MGHSVLLLSDRFCSTLLYSTLLCSSLLCPTLLFYFILCCTLLCSALLYSTLLSCSQGPCRLWSEPHTGTVSPPRHWLCLSSHASGFSLEGLLRETALCVCGVGERFGVCIYVCVRYIYLYRERLLCRGCASVNKFFFLRFYWDIIDIQHCVSLKRPVYTEGIILGLTYIQHEMIIIVSLVNLILSLLYILDALNLHSAVSLRWTA